MEWRLHEKNNTQTEKKIVEKEREYLEYLRRFILEKDFVTLFIIIYLFLRGFYINICYFCHGSNLPFWITINP